MSCIKSLPVQNTHKKWPMYFIHRISDYTLRVLTLTKSWTHWILIFTIFCKLINYALLKSLYQLFCGYDGNTTVLYFSRISFIYYYRNNILLIYWMSKMILLLKRWGKLKSCKKEMLLPYMYIQCERVKRKP